MRANQCICTCYFPAHLPLIYGRALLATYIRFSFVLMFFLRRDCVVNMFVGKGLYYATGMSLTHAENVNTMTTTTALILLLCSFPKAKTILWSLQCQCGVSSWLSDEMNELL